MSHFLAIALLQLSLALSSALEPPTAQTGFRTRENNVHAPQLYADKLDFIATLVKLPGANNKRSYWELSYQLYFIPEESYWTSIRRLPRGGSGPSADFFPRTILIAEGHRKSRRIGTLDDRTITLTRLAFKQKVPDALRTKFAVVMTSYTVKIFDAQLNTTVTDSGIFVTDPFDTSPDHPNQVVARKTIYLNFGVNPNGTLNGSQTPRSQVVTRWK
ncbi:MAG: hypothetical protein ABR594_19725 [Pyrinomonadaceae bacterium]